MGQRFTFDGSIMQSLVYDNVQELNGKFREFPSGLDVMAVLGSGPALATLQAHGDTAYPNYSKTLAELQQAANQQTESDWLSRAYDSWLYAFMPVLASKDSSYPPFMQSAAWNYRELNTALGSWAELKHDTALYSKRPEGRGGGGPPSSPTPPAYVDPNPQVFYRLAYLVASIQEGLSNRGMDYSWGTYGLDSFGEKLKVLGDIAVKELSGVDLNEDDYWAIRSCIDPVECEKLMNETSGDALPMPPVPIVAAVAGARDQVLEVATGKLNRIYVVVPLNGKLQVAQGGIYSYYEFLQSRSNVLTDQQWQSQVENNAVQLPDWSGKFMLPGGNITNWIAFNIGDVYIINAAGDNLNLRETASTKANVVDVLKKGDFITILGGPVQADQHTWWHVKGFFTGTTGWVVENQAWYERAWGQSP